MHLGGLVMKLTKCRIGDCVEVYNEACGIPKLTVDDVSGVNRDKEFFEPSKQVGSDTSKYKIVPPNYFACNLMHVGRDRLLPIALNHTEANKYVSPAYTVFKIKEGTSLLRDYFFMMLKSDERDRYFWFHTDSSVRDGMSWDDFCDLTFRLPTVDIQQKYVNTYQAMLANQRSYENGLEDLKLACESIINNYKHKSEIKYVRDILEEIDLRNGDNEISDVQGLNINKQFMPSVADTNKVDLRKYKIVKKGQFAFSGMQTGRDKCIRIALFDKDEPIIISPAYSVFKVKTSGILPEYVMMWFSRNEVDRLGWFVSDSSVRANLDMDRFNEIAIPTPDIAIQKAIVEIYNSFNLRREINERLQAQIKDMCPILIKGSIEEARI